MQSCIIKIIIHLYGDSYTNKHFCYTSIKLIQLSLNLFLYLYTWWQAGLPQNQSNFRVSRRAVWLLQQEEQTTSSEQQ